MSNPKDTANEDEGGARVVTIEKDPPAARLARRLEACAGSSTVVSAKVVTGEGATVDGVIVVAVLSTVTVSVTTTIGSEALAVADGGRDTELEHEIGEAVVLFESLPVLLLNATPPSTPVALMRDIATASVVHDKNVPFRLTAGKAKHCSDVAHASVFQIPLTHCATDPLTQALP